MAPEMQLAEWILDTGLYGCDVVTARDVYVTLKKMMVGAG
jgi:hypothetical protein